MFEKEEICVSKKSAKRVINLKGEALDESGGIGNCGGFKQPDNPADPSERIHGGWLVHPRNNPVRKQRV